MKYRLSFWIILIAFCCSAFAIDHLTITITDGRSGRALIHYNDGTRTVPVTIPAGGGTVFIDAGLLVNAHLIQVIDNTNTPNQGDLLLDYPINNAVIPVDNNTVVVGVIPNIGGPAIGIKKFRPNP